MLARFRRDSLACCVDRCLHAFRLEDFGPSGTVVFNPYFRSHQPFHLVSVHLVLDARPVGDLVWNTSPITSYNLPS